MTALGAVLVLFSIIVSFIEITRRLGIILNQEVEGWRCLYFAVLICALLMLMGGFCVYVSTLSDVVLP